MFYKNICKILAYYLFGLSIALGVPLVLAAYYQFFADPLTHPQPHTTIHFFSSMAIALVLSFLCYSIGRHSTGHLYRREGLVAVVMIWFLTPAIASLPFYLSGTLQDPIHAYFEATSGFTTTGATTMQAKKYNADTGEEMPITVSFCGAHTTKYIYWGTIKPVRDPHTGQVVQEGIEAVSKALLFWRSLTQWLGGMGVVVLFVAILPAFGVGGKILFQTEVPGPIKDSLTPRIKETAIQLWKIYSALSLIEISLLMMTNKELDLFNAITITFSTMSTGGFSVKNASIGGYDNVATDWVVMIFMIVGSINFSLYYFALRGKLYRIFDREFIIFLMIVLFSCSLASWLLVGTEKILMTGIKDAVFTTKDAIRYASFQVISGMTTTGFATADLDIWPYAIQVLMIITIFFGGMSGSTAGGIKVVRLFMLFKIAQHKVESLFRPEAIRRFKIGDREVDQQVALTVLVYFLLLVATTVFSIFIFVLDGIDPESALSAVTSLINNTGIGFRMASPTQSFAFMSDFALVLSSLLMLLGRLEFLAVLAVLVPAFWQQAK